MIEIHPLFRDWMQRHNLNTWDAVVGLLNLDATHPPRNESIVKCISLGTGEGAPGEVFLKVYLRRSPSWKRIGRHSKAVREFKNYRTFQQLQIPCPQPVAVGEKRDAIGRLHAAFIITQAVPAAITLIEYFNRPELNRRSAAARKRRLTLLAVLARQTRRLHDHCFYHYDLAWRNLVVSGDVKDTPCVSWIDCPSGRFFHTRFMQERKCLRDLGSFDKSASRQCTAGERLHFFKSYFADVGKLDAAGKGRIRQVLDYRRHRWPDDWSASDQGLTPPT